MLVLERTLVSFNKIDATVTDLDISIASCNTMASMYLNTFHPSSYSDGVAPLWGTGRGNGIKLVNLENSFLELE